MTDKPANQGRLRRFLSANAWIGYAVAYLVGLGYTIAGATTLYTALAQGYISGPNGPQTFDSDPADFVIKVAISGVTTLILGTLVVYATAGGVHVWRRKRRARPDGLG